MNREEIINGFAPELKVVSSGENTLQATILNHVVQGGKDGVSPAVLINRMKGERRTKAIAEECANLVEAKILGVRPMVKKYKGKLGFVFYVMT